MSETSEGRPGSSIQELRQQAELKHAGAKDALAKRTRVEWEIFCNLEEHQITQELTVNWIKTEEAYYRELANQELSEKDVNVNTLHSYQRWEKHHDALLGATGKGPVSKTIELLRDDANGWKDMANKNRKKLNEGGPFGENLAFSVSITQEQISGWDKITSNLNTAARLFENDTKFAVAEKPSEQPVQ